MKIEDYIDHGVLNNSKDLGIFIIDGVFTVPEGVIRIGNSLLSNNPNLKEIILPKSLIAIDNYFLYNCKNLKEIKLPERLTYVGDCFLNYCENINEIKIPDKLLNIGLYFLYNSNNIEKIKFEFTQYDILSKNTSLRFESIIDAEYRRMKISKLLMLNNQ